MDQAANTFVDELVKISGKNFVDDVKVKDKVCRFTFDIMLTCLLGDSSDIQTRNRFKKSSCVPVIFFFHFFYIFTSDRRTRTKSKLRTRTEIKWKFRTRAWAWTRPYGPYF